MKNYRNVLFYILIIGGFSFLMYWIVQLGGDKETAGKILDTHPEQSNWIQFKNSLNHSLTHPLSILLLQILAIIIIARIFGFICRKIGQPTVIGEIAAGIVLGPSLVGMYFPEFSAFLFPKESLGNLQFLSQIGLILFMYVIGMELDLKVLKNKAHEAIVISHASIIIPFALGMGLAYYTYEVFAPENINFLSFSLFMGIAMSITAFPVLARIVQERGLTKTKVGTVVITCAAADDITAWCILAAVIAIVKAGSFLSSVYTILLALVYIFIMLKLVQPFLKRLGDIHSNKESLSKPIVAIFFITLISSAYAAEVIGVHALFGAFLAGVIMPSNINFRNLFIDKIEDVALVLLLPLFFVFTGLRTQIGLLNDSSLWGMCGIIILIAITGKFAGSALAARFVGQRWKDSLTIGALMNTRGLVELVVLNIGYDLGVLTPEIFAMLVIMALITTCMTGPALDLINKYMPEKTPTSAELEIEDLTKYKILLSFGNPQSGKNMLRLVNSLIKNSQNSSTVTALHLSPSNEIHSYNVEQYERESFLPIKSEARKLNVRLNTLYKPSNDIEREIVDTANNGNYDLMIIGAGQSAFEGTLLGKLLGLTTKIINPDKWIDTIKGEEKLFENTFFDTTKQIVKLTQIPVGIFIDKGLNKVNHVFIAVYSLEDCSLLTFAQKLIHNNDSVVTILDFEDVIKANAEAKETIRAIEQIAPNNISLVSGGVIDERFLSGQDLMITNLATWRKILADGYSWLEKTPSVLVIKN